MGSSDGQGAWCHAARRAPCEQAAGAACGSNDESRWARSSSRTEERRSSSSGARLSSSVNHRPSAASRMRLALAGGRPSDTRACCQADEAFAQRLQQLGVGRHAGDDRGSEAPLPASRGVAGRPEGRLEVRPREGSGSTRPGTFPLEILVERRAEALHHGRDERGTRGEVIEDPAFADAGLARRGFEREVGDAVAKDDLLRAEQDPFAGRLQLVSPSQLYRPDGTVGSGSGPWASSALGENRLLEPLPGPADPFLPADAGRVAEDLFARS